jgi:hypothetical protein
MNKLEALRDNFPARIGALRYIFLKEKSIKKINFESPVLLDTSVYSDNAGDYIIMDYVNMQLNSIWPDYVFPRLSTHSNKNTQYDSIENSAKILCGTNALPLSINRSIPVSLPSNPETYRKSMILLAVGLRGLNHNEHFTKETAHLIRNLLADGVMHSVRDSHTKQCLNEIGVKNVINTSCVTLWKLTESFCRTIPSNKHKDVLTTITDYCFSPSDDSFMIETLKKHYRNVYLWIQGRHDLALFRQLHIDNVKLIFGGFSGLEEFVQGHDDFDYFGTRLHCGIYCLNHKKRSMIVSVDNRAEDIERDTNIPTVKRESLKLQMDALIESPRSADIHIPEDEINTWRGQFLSLRRKD